ncbi:MAG: efflux transporter periplasmic adaptor subunit, partial [Hylemonella sp.]
LAAGQFRLTPVDLGPASNGLRPLLKGPAEGTPVVVDGAFHLNNERKRAELE